MIRIEFSEAQKAALHHERFHHPHPRVQQKMEVLWLKSQGVAHQDICRLAQVNGKTLTSYLHQYEEGGIERLKQVNFHGRPSQVHAHRQSIEAYLREHPPATINEACARIAEVTGIRRSPTQVRLFLRDHCGMKRLKTGVLPAKADPVAQEAFKKKTLEPKLAEAQAGKRALFFVDAAHLVFGAFACMLWCWSRLWVRAPSGRQRFNLLGALNAVSHEVITITNTDYINSHSVCALLHKLKLHTPHLPITVVLDNARYQRCRLVQTLAATLNIELLFLPPYSPNLNLIERMWKFVRSKCLYGQYYPTFDAFTTAIQSCLSQTNTTHRDALRSLLTLNFQSFAKA